MSRPIHPALWRHYFRADTGMLDSDRMLSDLQVTQRVVNAAMTLHLARSAHDEFHKTRGAVSPVLAHRLSKAELTHADAVRDYLAVHNPALTVALAQQDRLDAHTHPAPAAPTAPAPYGYCPTCHARGVRRERRLNGHDTCENQHTYPSRDALLDPVKPPAMTTPTTADMFERFASLILAERLRMAMGTARADQEDVAFLDQLDADIEAARATIARLEGELSRAYAAIDDPVDGIKGVLARLTEQRTRADAAERRGEAMAKGLKAVEALINESHGVIGLHLNGDDAPWEDLRTGGSFEEWLREFDTALAAASDDTATTEG